MHSEVKLDFKSGYHVICFAMSFLKETYASAGAALCFILGVILCYGKIGNYARKSAPFRGFLSASEILFAAGLSVVVGIFDLWKKSTWIQREESLSYGLFFWILLLGLYVIAKLLTQTVKNEDQSELLGFRIKAKTLEYQRDDAIRTLSLIREIVELKLNRLSSLNVGKPQVTVDSFLKALDPEGQVQTILKSIHGFYARQLQPGASLRLCLYTRDPKDPKSLIPALAWDGKTKECFRKRNKKYMQIGDPKGAQSIVATCYHSPQNLITIPDCIESAAKQEFHYFHQDQREYLCSMLAFKHIFAHNGEHDAFIISLDSSQRGFFKKEDEQQNEQFLVEMVKRIEYELLGMEIRKKLALQGI